MRRARASLCKQGRRQSRTGTLVGASVALLVALGVCFGLWPAAFTFSPASNSSAGTVLRGVRMACRAQGGEVMVDYVVGDACKAESPDDEIWYPGTVSAVNEDGTFTVTWDDPDGGPETETVQPEKLKKVNIFKGYKEGEEVLAVFPDDGAWYPGSVTAVKTDGTFVVKWDDPDGGPEESTLGPKQIKFPRIPVDKLEVGAKYEGTVKGVQDFGAFVDIGAESEGMVHISRVSHERIENIHDHLQEGQEVEVWVSEVKDDGKFSLSMVEGRPTRPSSDYVAFEGISSSDWLEGTVTGLARFGAFVRVRSPGGAEASGLLHVSAIREGFIEDVSTEVQEGDLVKVRVVRVDPLLGQLSLSMKKEGSGGSITTRPKADLTPFEGLSQDKWFTGKVASITKFGAFVTLTLDDGPSAEGLVHIRHIKAGFVESVADELQVGQNVNVRVLSADSATGKMSLSMKL